MHGATGPTRTARNVEIADAMDRLEGAIRNLARLNCELTEGPVAEDPKVQSTSPATFSEVEVWTGLGERLLTLKQTVDENTERLRALPL